MNSQNQQQQQMPQNAAFIQSQMLSNQQMQQNPQQQQIKPIMGANAQLAQGLTIGLQNSHGNRGGYHGRGGHGHHIHNNQQFPSLYAGNLPTNFYDLELYKAFSSKGYKLKKAVVKCDHKTQKPLQYGFLTFYTEEEAERCLNEMNNAVIGGKPIRLNHQKNNQKFDPEANVIVKNLANNLTQKDIFDHFSQYGKIVSLKLETFADNRSRGFCYIQFETAELASSCIEKANGSVVGDKEIVVMKHEKRGARPQTEARFTNLFVQNLEQGTDDAKLKQMFQEFGEIVSAHVQRDESAEGNLKDYGYVSFAEPDCAAKAMDQMNKKQLPNGGFLFVNQHVSKRINDLANNNTPIQRNIKKTYDANIFVKYIPNDVNEDKLRDTFSENGQRQIISIKLKATTFNVNGHQSSPYQQAFILFNDVQDAQNAIKNFDQSNIFGSKPLSVDFWMSKEDINAEKELKSRQMLEMLSKREFMSPNGNPFAMALNELVPNMGGNNFNNQYQNNNMQGQYNNNRNYQNHRRQGGRGGRGGYMNQQQRMNQNNNNMPMPVPQQNMMNQQIPPTQMQQPQPQQMQQQQQQQMPSYPKPQLAPIQVDVQQIIAIQDENEKKQAVGNAIYGTIQQTLGEAAGKITGMLLDTRVVDINKLISDHAYLCDKVGEAYILLAQAQKQEQQQQMQQIQQQQPAPQQ